MTATPYGLNMLWSQGDMAIKTVAMLLLLMSIASWWIIATHCIKLLRLRAASKAVERFWHSHSFSEAQALLAQSGNQVTNVYHHLAQQGLLAVEHHQQHSQDLHGQLSLAQWLSESLSGTIDDDAERLQSGLSVLASVGSTAPFIGLFGTVWGIYHALVGIGTSGQASIDKVAGPVGEALIMTALGLAVAIPAVLAYNALIRANRRVINRLQRFARQLHAYFVMGSNQMDASISPRAEEI
jgi:biopolymer transport protein ExbB